MGEVYRGRDTRLDRTVAIKILPRELSHDPEFRQRFEREARALSSLTHPHICTVYDVGHNDGTDYLVMEYLEGETLADRLSRGPLPIDQLIRFGKEIADALETAHRAGIIHRDLKPANVMLTKGGAKLLDFGLAKWSATQIFRPHAGRPFDKTFEQEHPLTGVGSILGTIHYMAPEQLQGRPADSRADIFAFGALLYEMATGRRAFDGESAASVIAAILERDPPPARDVQSLTPPLLDRLLRACLQKDPELRMQSAHDVRLALEWIEEATPLAASPTLRRRASTIAVVVALLFLATMIALGMMLVRTLRHAAPLAVSVPPPPETSFRFSGDAAGPAVISPNGRLIAFVATDAHGMALWIRPLHEAKATKLPSTDGAMFPFWSPDSRSIGFFAGESLKRIEISGGPPVEIAHAPNGRGGAWSDRGVIVFAPQYEGGLFVVPASGGPAKPLTTVDRKSHSTHRWPVFIDSRRFLFLAANHEVGRADQTAIFRGDLDSREPRRLMSAQSQGDWSDGHVLFVRDGTLFALRLDDEPRDLPRPVAENVYSDSTTWRAAFSASKNNVLVYHSGGSGVGTQLTWFDRSGTVLGKLGERDLIDNVRISPDGRQVAVDIGDVVHNVWIFDVSSGLRRRLTYTAGIDMIPVWSPDGSRIAFSSSRQSAFDIYVMNANGAGGETRLITSNVRKVASDWSRDGRHLVFNHREPSSDLWVLNVDQRTPRSLVETPADEYSAQFSPDGRWIAYTSHETGRGEIFIAAFPTPAAKWQISTNGGRVARWRGDGRELFYLTPDNQLMAVELRMEGEAPEIVATKSLFVAKVKPIGLSYDVSRDGQRFLMNAMGDEGSRPLNVIVNLEIKEK